MAKRKTGRNPEREMSWEEISVAEEKQRKADALDWILNGLGEPVKLA